MALKLADRKAFAGALARAMRSQDELQPAALAATAGCTTQYVKMLLGAHANPGARLFFHLASNLGVEPDRLMPESAQRQLHGWSPEYRAGGAVTQNGGAVTHCHAESRIVRNSHASEADRLDAELLCVADALREADVVAVELHDVARELESLRPSS